MISQWIQQALVFVTHNPSYGYLFSFLISFLESLPIVGTIVPGSITMTAVGTLIGTDALPLIPTFASAIIGAFLGDFTGFLVGRLGEEKIFNVWPFKNRRNWLDFGRQFFKKHGGKSVVIGRFIGPIRSAIPMVASILGMSYGRFILAGTCSAILWSVLYIFPGYLLGKYSKSLTHQELAKWITLFLVVAIILAIIYIGYKAAIYCYRRYYSHKIDTYWATLTNRSKRIKFFANPNMPSNALPFLLFTWIATLTILLLIYLASSPFCSLHLLQLYPKFLHYFSNHHLFKQLEFLSPFSSLSILLIFSTFLTATTSVGLKKGIQSSIIFIFLLAVIYLFLGSNKPFLLTLIYQNYLLWLPLAFFTFTKASEYKAYSTSIYIIYGVITLMSNLMVIIQHDLSIYIWILSWLATAIMISIYSLLSLRITEPKKNQHLDSMVIHIPFFILLTLFTVFF